MSWTFTQEERTRVYDAWRDFSDQDFDDDSLERLVSVLVPIAAKSHDDCGGEHIVDERGRVTCLHNGALIE